MYNFNHLYYFYITVKSDGVTAAAKHLRISQPSLSGQLKVLEENIQTKLFRKVGRKNELTKEGSIIFGFCRKMFELSEEMEESITEKIPHVSRRINIGVSVEIANSFLVEVISHFLGKFNERLRPKITMITESHEKLSELLRFREIDVIVSPFNMTDPDLENLQQLEVPVNLICTKNKVKINNTRQRKDSILNILNSYYKGKHAQWVMPSTGLKLRTEINQFAEEYNLKGRTVFESDVIESLTRSIVDNIGISFLPLIYVAKELENNVVESYGPRDGFWKYKIGLSCHVKSKDDHLISELSKSLLDICKPVVKKKKS